MLKKIIYLIVSGGLLLSGCSLDYEPLNGPSSGSFPASEEEAMAGLYAAYKGLANMTVTRQVSSRMASATCRAETMPFS